MSFEIPSNVGVATLHVHRHLSYTSRSPSPPPRLLSSASSWGLHSFFANLQQSVPLNFRAMFHQYFQMAHRIRKHYLSPRVLLCLLTGQYVPPLNRKNLYSLQYSMLPARRSTTWEMWRAVSAEGRETQARIMKNKRPLPVDIPALSNGGKRGMNGKLRGSR